MCISPSFVHAPVAAGFEKIPVPCRRCWQCRADYVRDYVGRCLAEASGCVACASVTLTYAPRDDFADRVVNPQHFQNFVKLLRWHGHKFKYLVASETGRNGTERVHFHCVLMFTHLAPLPEGAKTARYGAPGPLSREITSDGKNNIHLTAWPHGHVHWQWSVSARAVRYVCKYALKGDKGQWLSMSKKPPIGHDWFQAKARLVRDLGVLPWSFRYLPPGVEDDARGYLMTGVTRRNYLETLLENPKLRRTANEWVEKSIQKLDRHLMRRAEALLTQEETRARDLWLIEMAIEGRANDFKERDQRRYQDLIRRTEAVYGPLDGPEGV